MLSHPAEKYRPYPPIALPDRRWARPAKSVTPRARWPLDPTCATATRRWRSLWTAPANCSSGILLLECGFKEIEVAFPSASQTDFPTRPAS